MLEQLISRIAEVLYKSSNIPEADRFSAMRGIYTAGTGDELADALMSLPEAAQVEVAESVEA